MSEAALRQLRESIARQSLADAGALLSCKSYDEIPFDVDDERVLAGLSYRERNCLVIRAAFEALNSILDDLENQYPEESRALYPMLVVTDWQQFVDGRLQDVDGDTALLVVALWCGNFMNPALASFRLFEPAERSDQSRFVASCLDVDRSDHVLYEGINDRYGEPSVERVYVRSLRALPPWEVHP